jgi:hypothetical protein
LFRGLDCIGQTVRWFRSFLGLLGASGQEHRNGNFYYKFVNFIFSNFRDFIFKKYKFLEFCLKIVDFGPVKQKKIPFIGGEP